MMRARRERVEVALIRDWRKLLVVESTREAPDVQNWQADLAVQHQRFWEEGWQAFPTPAAPTTPKLIAVLTTRSGMQAGELAQTDFKRWNWKANAIRDWLIPLHLDTNHGYAKEQVVIRELAKRQAAVHGRIHRLEQLAQARRARLADLQDQMQHLQEQMRRDEQQWMERS